MAAPEVRLEKQGRTTVFFGISLILDGKETVRINIIFNYALTAIMEMMPGYFIP